MEINALFSGSYQDTVGRPGWPEQSELTDKVGRLLGAAGPVFGLWVFGLRWGVVGTLSTASQESIRYQSGLES